MNPTLDILLNRKSIRAFEKRDIEADVKTKILEATLRAPTAGKMPKFTSPARKATKPVKTRKLRLYRISKNCASVKQRVCLKR